jgi:hypothetical protein
MALENLETRRQEVVDWHKRLESVPDSPWSPEHPEMQRRLQRKERLLSERPVAFIDDDRVWLVGGDAETVTREVAEWLPQGQKGAVPGGRGDHLHAVRCAERLGRGQGKVEGGLCLDARTWNGLLYALAERGVHVVTADLNSPPK